MSDLFARSVTSIRRFSHGESKPLEDLSFLADEEFPAEFLADLVAQARRLGVSAPHLMLARGLIDEERLYQRLAAYLGVACFDGHAKPALDMHWREALETGHAQLADGSFLIAPRDLAFAQIAQHLSADIHAGRIAIAAPSRFESWVMETCRRDMADAAAHELAQLRPDLSAREGLAKMQRRMLLLLAFGFAAGLTAIGALWALLCFVIGLLMLLAVILRLSALIRSFAPRPMTPSIRDEDAPTYSILIALYREAQMVGQLVSALRAMDYPPEKIEVLFLLEQDDRETHAALENSCLPPGFRILTVPAGWPRTKPRALNFGLLVARGELVVVYDAEDRPDQDQLRKAAYVFSNAPKELACLQASLVIENPGQSWLTRLFALDYAGQFDVVLRGFSNMGLPIPLGGSSNHFRTSALREVGGWDAWNVTEDADLGLRLARFSHLSRMLDSATLEEAPACLQAWFAQRRRWMKGWLQTLLTHTRHPVQLFRDLGPARGAHVLALLLSHTFGPLAGIWLTVYVLHEAWIGDLLAWRENVWRMAAPFFWAGLASVGLVALVAPTFVGAARRHLWSSLLWLILRPVHWLCLSAASICAVYELCRRPFHWAKTPHGLSKAPGQDHP